MEWFTLWKVAWALVIEDGEKENAGKKKEGKNSQGKDPKTFEENSQGGDRVPLKKQPG